VYPSSVRVAIVALLTLVLGCETATDRPATWTYLHAAVIAPNCATIGCHSQISSTSGRDLSTVASGYVMLTSHTCGAPPHPQDPPASVWVAPVNGDPEQAGLVQLMRGVYMDLRYSDRPLLMPPDQPLPDAEIDLVVSWIARGAPCD
jgi:hypothetical protein